MSANRWLFFSLLLFIIIETVGGCFWYYSALLATAIYVLIFTATFFGLFFLFYLSAIFYAEANPWVSKVDEMEWCFNPMYMPWLFSTNKRKWACYATIISALLSPFFGALIFYIFMNGMIDFNSSLIGFSVASGFLILLALSWYEGFWKPRTREIKTEDIYTETGKEER
jgi:hypothetical protein